MRTIAATPRTRWRARIALLLAALAAVTFGATSHAFGPATADIGPPMQSADHQSADE